MSGKRSKGNYGRPQTGARVGTCPLIENVQDYNYSFNYILVRTKKNQNRCHQTRFTGSKLRLRPELCRLLCDVE